MGVARSLWRYLLGVFWNTLQSASKCFEVLLCRSFIIKVRHSSTSKHFEALWSVFQNTPTTRHSNRKLSIVMGLSTTLTQWAPKTTRVGKIAQNKGHFAVQGHWSHIFSRGPVAETYSGRIVLLHNHSLWINCVRNHRNVDFYVGNHRSINRTVLLISLHSQLQTGAWL